MITSLPDRVAIVTGGAQGLGQAICLRLAAEGCHVVVADINLEKAQQTADLVKSAHAGRQSIAVKVDVTDEEQVAGMVKLAEETFGRVDILVSNTGSQIAPEKMQEIFRPFHGSKNSNHLGLGLTIAAMLSHQMNIQLGVASENNTTTFWLSCPMA